MAFKDLALAVLRGGLPAALDDPNLTTQQGDTRPEKTAPEPQLKDREPFLQVLDEQGAITQQGLIAGGAALVALVALIVWIARSG